MKIESSGIYKKSAAFSHSAPSCDPANACCDSTSRYETAKSSPPAAVQKFSPSRYLALFTDPDPAIPFWQRIAGGAALPIALPLLFAGCGGGDDRTGCRDDNDCRAPRVCVNGSCETPSGNEDGGHTPECYSVGIGNFNEQFEGNSLNECWETLGSSPEVSGGELRLPTGQSISYSKRTGWLTDDCYVGECTGNNFTLEYKIKFPGYPNHFGVNMATNLIGPAII